MNVIFKDLNLSEIFSKVVSNRAVQNVSKFINNNKILVKVVCVCLVCATMVGISVTAAGITFGYDVECDGKIIATVRDASVLEKAKNLASRSVEKESIQKAIVKPQLAVTLTVADKLDNAESVANAIIENSEKIVLGSALKVNGEIVACVISGDLESALEARKNAYNKEGLENNSSFVDSIEIESGYYLKKDVVEAEAVNDIINALQVKTVSTVVTDSSVAFKTTKVKTDTQYLGYYKVTSKGKNGVNRKTEQVEFVNGVETARTLISQETVSAPINEVITVGTAKAVISATEKSNVTSDGFICPISKGKYVISAYYGDGRNHKGIDLAADKGVAIFAVSAGTVTYAGYDSDFGYNIIIDHGNGIKTRYAHASAMCVSKGQSVSQGDMIAAVGSTGRSTGNHLHFEIIVNGKRVNPAPYLGF